MEFTEMPGFCRYEISKSGNIRSIESKKTITPTVNGSQALVVNLKSDTGKWRTIPVARAVLATYVPLSELWKYRYTSVSFRDGDRENVRLSNLVWSLRDYVPPLIPGTNCPHDTFVGILGWDRYQINLNGVIRDKKTGRTKIGFIQNGYHYVDLYTESGKPVRKGIHRLLALTFLHHPVDCDHLVINHKDGVPLNNTLSNLEWCTYSDNMNHAYDMGFRKEAIAILAKCLETGREYRFRSYGEAAKLVGATYQALHDWITGRINITPYRGYLFKTECDSRPWPDMTEMRNDVFCLNQPVPITMTNLNTGETRNFRKLGDASRELRIAPKTILNHTFGDKKGIPYKEQYVFSSPVGDTRIVKKVRLK